MQRIPTDLPERWRDVLRRLRRLELALANQGSGVSDTGWVRLAPYLNAGWFSNGTDGQALDACIRKIGNQVFWRGGVEYISGTGTDHTAAFLTIPADYLPSRGLWRDIARVDDFNTGTAEGKSWVVQVQNQAGLTALFFQQHPDFAASPNFGYPPDQTTFLLETIRYFTD